MRVDAFLVDRLHLESGNTFILLEGEGDVANEVFDKDGIVVGLHGDVAFVGTLQQGIDWCGSSLLGDGDEFFDPDEFPPTAFLLFGADLDGHVPTLIVSAVVADLLTARTESLDWHLNPHSEIVLLAIRFAEERDFAADFGFGPRNRCCLLDEIGKAHLDLRALGIQALLQVVQNEGQGAHGDLPLVRGQHLQKPTHVSALEVVGQMNRHRDRRHCRQRFAVPVHDLDGILQVGDAYLINGNTSGVSRLLNVWERS